MVSQKAKTKKNDSLIVGIGASAGGLMPLKAFFHSLPNETGMSFIVIQHLSPKHESNLADLLQGQTALTVEQVKDKTEIQPEHIYIIPPNKLLKVGDNHLELSEFERNDHKPQVVDLFLRSLGERKGMNSACIILSGSGSDGAVGMKTIKENGGLTIAQNPSEAQYSSMPQSAIDTGLIDKILPVEAMADELLDYKQNLDDGNIDGNTDKLSERDLQALTGITDKLKEQTDHDFTHYKKSTMLRRIERRMHVTHKETLANYRAYLDKEPEEVQKLFKDLLISVTNFFRNPEAFEALEKKVIPELFEKLGKGKQLRVWVPGCATGEEAYSIGMLLHEYAEKTDDSRDIQIFATDIDEAALNLAREGKYPTSIASDVSEERLERYFYKENDKYIVKQTLRRMILFAKHNMLSSPPFSKLHLISCRNLLIYLNRELQGEVFNLFHYALTSEGYLFLGKSDSNLEATELFTPYDKKYNMFRQSSKAQSSLPLPEFPLQINENQIAATGSWRMPSHTKQNFEKLHRRLMMRDYVPPSVIINENYEVLHATSGIDAYLKYHGGEPSRNILEMALPELRSVIRSMLYKATKDWAELPLRKNTRAGTGGDTKIIEISLFKVNEDKFPGDLMYLVFEELHEEKSALDKSKTKREVIAEGDRQLVRELEEELKNTKEQLQVTIEDYETSNEELRSSNEELQSMNEELQTTTEELETSQEELQSVNEELKTVNSELEDKIDKLNHINDDLRNLTRANPTGLVIVTRDFQVQRFTASATDIFNLIDSDVGRPLADLNHNLKYERFLRDVEQVLHTLQEEEKIVRTKNDKMFMMRIMPYLTANDKVKGVVLSFVDITKLKKHEEQLRQEAEQVEVLAQLGLHAIEGQPVENVIHRGLQLACEILAIDYCLLLELDREQNDLRLKEATGHEAESVADLDVQFGSTGDVAKAVDNMKPMIVEDFSKEERFSPVPVVKGKEITSGVNVPVEGSKQPYGVLGMYSIEKRTFTEHDKSFLQVIANLFAETIDRQKNEDALKATNRSLEEEMGRSRGLQQEILDTNMAERWELGGFLHDTLGQKLVAVKMIADGLSRKHVGEGEDGVAEDLERMQEILGGSINEIRDLSRNIIPVDIDTGVGHAFEHLVKDSEKLYDIECELDYDEAFAAIKDRKLATNLYLIAQEAIKNAHNHGKARRVNISARCNDHELTLQIKDDGSGMAKEDREKSDGSGTHIMQHRADILNGSLQVDGFGDGEYIGVAVTCKVPL